MLGFVGCGNMAQAMLKGILAKGLYKADEIIVSRRTKEALDALHEELATSARTFRRKPSSTRQLNTMPPSSAFPP